MEYRPRIVSWNITGACHLRCAHCYLNARRRRPGELTTGEALRLIDQMAEAGTELLILTGGEPLLRRDLPVLARHAANQGIHVVLGTTGTLITRQRAKTLKDSGVAAAGISIDSLDPAKHDAFRSLPGAWQRAVQGMEVCRHEGLEVLVHTTALKMNQEEIPDIIQFAHDHGARAFHLFFLVCTGRGEQLTDLSPKEYEDLLSLGLDTQERYPDMMVRARCAPYIGRLAVERGVPTMGSAGCLAGTSYCRITPTGDVTPCPYLPTRVGNIRQGTFQDIWATSPLLTQFRAPQRQLGGKCGQCLFSQGDEPLCVGCRARAFSLAGDTLAADPWCLYQPDQPQTLAETVSPAHGGRPNSAQQGPIVWTPEAHERLGRVPFFIRGRVRQSAEAYARQRGLTEVSEEVLEHLRQGAYGHPGKWPSSGARNSAAERKKHLL
ncbi:MAG: radical SAM protein [Chloroflexi bacterium]|nr:radical SAM protein [Chloroflexota bacterium]